VSLGGVDRPVQARWYLARIVGAGTIADPYRAATADRATSHTAVIPTKADGTPRYAWALVQAPDDADIATDADHIPLPLNPRTRWASAPAAARQRVLDRVSTAFGLTLQADPNDTVTDVARALGRALDGAGFDPASVKGV
jgi:hypothetical protein